MPLYCNPRRDFREENARQLPGVVNVFLELFFFLFPFVFFFFFTPDAFVNYYFYLLRTICRHLKQ